MRLRWGSAEAAVGEGFFYACGRTPQPQPFRGYLKLTLIFIWNSALWGSLNAVFDGLFCEYQQNFHFGGRIGHEAIIKFKDFP